MSKDENFAVLYQKNYSRLFWRANRILKESHAAEDIVQETFIELWNRLDKVQKPDYWLYTIVTNKSINCLKELKHETVFEFELLERQLDTTSYCTDLEIRLYYGDLIEKMKKELYKKNKKWYNIIRQLFFENKSQKEVAELIDITVNDLREMLFRIRIWLRKEFLEKDICAEFSI